MGIMTNKVDMSLNEVTVEDSIKYGLVDPGVRDLVSVAKNNPNICRAHTASQEDFNNFTARVREAIKTSKAVSLTRLGCHKEYSSQ